MPRRERKTWIIYPEYFDRSNSRSNGRRVPKNVAVKNPKIEEIGKGKGKGYNMNAPLAHGNGEEAVQDIVHDIFLPIAEQFDPDLILVSSGFDSHHADRMGGLHLTVDFFGDLIKQYQNIQSKIVCTLEGGYNLDWIGKCLVSQVGQLAGFPQHFDDATTEKNTSEQVYKKLKKKLQPFWKL